MIPKKLHQTYFEEPPKNFKDLMEITKDANPQWEHNFYDDHDCRKYIKDLYGNSVLSLWNTINPKYGAVKADLFRYLVIYEEGGVYLDIKSCAIKDLNRVFKHDDSYLISFWDQNKYPGAGFPGYDFWPEALRNKGEIQQWFLCASRRHDITRKAIQLTLKNIKEYDINIHGVGLFGALRVSGPIMYSMLLLNHFDECRLVDSERDLGLIYAPLGRYQHHKIFEKQHYSSLEEPVILNANLPSRRKF